MISFKDSFKFCYRCKGDLKERSKSCLACTSCGFKVYLNPVPCNALFLRNDEGKILLVRRAREPRKGAWDAAGGFVDSFESLEESLNREVKEELGITIRDLKIIGGYSDHYLFQEIDVPTFGIFCTALIESGEITPGDDVDAAQFFTLDEALKQDLAFDSVKHALEELKAG